MDIDKFITPNIVVLMSTYNGEKYLREQLDSILNQEGVDVHIIVRDDGSTDGTVAIIEEYSRKHERKIVLVKGENIGWRHSFFELVAYASSHCDDGSFFAFADQDDIWLPTKLSVATAAIKMMPRGKPRLYCSNLYYYKNGTNYGKIHKEIPIPTFKNCLVRNYATGCTIVFDDNMLKLLASNLPTITIAHDYWAYMVAVLCGRVYIDNEAYILYRQHDNNQIGSKSGFLEVWKRRLANFSKSSIHFSRMVMAVELKRIFGTYMSADAAEAVNKMADYRQSLGKRLALLFDNGYTFNKRSNDFWFKLRIIFGKL